MKFRGKSEFSQCDICQELKAQPLNPDVIFSGPMLTHTC